MGLGVGERQTKDGEQGEGNTSTLESRFVPSFLGKGPSALLEEGRVGGETSCRTNETATTKIKMHMCPQKKANQALWNQSCRDSSTCIYDILRAKGAESQVVKSTDSGRQSGGDGVGGKAEEKEKGVGEGPEVAGMGQSISGR